MARIVLDLTKNTNQNAAAYFEKAKKAKKKLEGALDALARSRSRLAGIRPVAPRPRPAEKRKALWYEKFRWFFSSEGFLVIGGRDAATNEIVIKKHTEPKDIVFHTDMAGSPFFVVKSQGKKVGRSTLEEAADATASYSRAWKLGLAATQVFYVSPEQVTKKAMSGEYLGRGAFMVYGKTTYMPNKMRLAIGMADNRVMAGPVESVRKHCSKYVKIIQGNEKPSDAAKKIQATIGGGLDEIIRLLPSGGVKIDA